MPEQRAARIPWRGQFLSAILVAAAAQGALRHVPEDYPTIGAALAVAVAGDSVLVQPGLYQEAGLALPDRVTLLGLGGAGSAVLSGNGSSRLLEVGAPGARIQGLRFRHGRADIGGALRVNAGGARIEACVFDGNTALEYGGALYLGVGDASEVRGCTFANNHAPVGSALAIAFDQSPLIANSLFSLNTGGSVVSLDPALPPTITHCDIADNSPGDWTGFLAGFLGVMGNLDETPRFCQPAMNDWRLAENSLCLPGNNPDGESIGALGMGCGPQGLQAAFTLDPTTGGTPLSVVFTDQSAGLPLGWEWDFLGDGDWQAGGPQAVHVYEQAGVYHPRLRVTRGSAVSVTAGDIAVEPLFQVELQADRRAGRFPLSVHFQALPIGQPDSYEWSFGDGQTQTTSEPAVEHTYLALGLYDVGVTARDGHNEFVDFRQRFILASQDTLRVPQDVATLGEAGLLMDVGTVLLLPPGNHVTPDAGIALPAAAQVIGQADGGPVVIRMTPSGGTLMTVSAAGEPCLLRDLSFTLARNQIALRTFGQSRATVEDCAFTIVPFNSTFAVQAFDSSQVTVRRCAFAEVGIAIMAIGQAQVREDACSHVAEFGAAFSCTDDAVLEATGCHFQSGETLLGHASGRRLILRDSEVSHSLGYLSLSADSVLLDHVVFRDNLVPSNALLRLSDDATARFDFCVFAGNEGLLSTCALISATQAVQWTLENSLISRNLLLRPTAISCAVPQQVHCTDIYGNDAGDWNGVLQPFGEQPGNLSLDPLICDLEADSLYVTQDSPCLPQHNSCGVAIGGLSAGCTQTAVSADFSATPVEGLVPLAVAFTDRSSGQIESWQWDFESDGIWDSAEPDPVHIYLEPGSWSVTLRVANDEFDDTLRVENAIHCRVPRVLRVPQEYATIAAALAVAELADTVEVDCGAYHEHDLALPDWITLRSATGDPTCATLDAQGQGRVLTGSGLVHGIRVEGLTLTGGVALGSGAQGLGGAVSLSASNAVFSRCVFRGNQARFGGVGSASILDSLLLERCVLDGNSCLSSGAAWLFTGAPARLERCLVTSNSGGGLFGTAPQLACSDLFGNSHGNWSGGWAGQLGQDGNIEADPRYCDAPGGDFGLQTGSPCLPPASPCGAMGAWEGDCETGVAGPIPLTFSVGEAWPNPFNPVATLRVTLPEAARVQARLYNAKGQFVGTVLSGQRAAGTHLLRVDGSALASGVYLLQVKAGEHEAVRRLTLLK